MLPAARTNLHLNEVPGQVKFSSCVGIIIELPIGRWELTNRYRNCPVLKCLNLHWGVVHVA